MGTWLAVHSIDGGNNTGWNFTSALLNPNIAVGTLGTLGVSQEVTQGVTGNTATSSVSSVKAEGENYTYPFVAADLQRLVPGAIVDLFEFNYSSLPGGTILYFHGGVNGLGTDIVWRGVTYSRYPIDVEGFERSSSGTLPRPKIKVANILGSISTLTYLYQDLVGAKLTRRRTFVKYLDAINFPGGLNHKADPNVSFPDEIWSVDRKSSENAIFVEFELSAAFDVMGVLIPRRHCIQNTCTWAYRSAECGYAGGAVATKNDVATADLAQDKCGKRLSSCKLRFGAYAELPFGAFPGVGLMR